MQESSCLIDNSMVYIRKRNRSVGKGIMLFLNYDLIIALINNFLCLLGYGNSIFASITHRIFLILLVLFFVVDSYKNNRVLTLFGFIIFTITICLLSIFINDELWEPIKYFFPSMISFNAIAFYVGRIIATDFDDSFYNGDFFIILGYLYIFTLFRINDFVDYMGISYNLIFVACYSWIKAIVSTKKIYYCHSMLFAFFILLYGARGPFVLLVMMMILSLLYSEDSRRNRILKILIICYMFMLIALVFKTVMSVLVDFFPSSRTISLLAEGFSNNSYRSTIWAYSKKLIIDNPLSVNGIFSDRVLITAGNAYSSSLGFYVSPDMYLGLYAHNLFIEILIQFGLLFGGIILFLFAFYLLRFFYAYVVKSNDFHRRLFFILILIIAIVPLFFSFSYLSYKSFWVAIGMISIPVKTTTILTKKQLN